MTDPADDEPPTKPQTPSAMHRLGLVPCPKCHGAGGYGDSACTLCNGGKAVAVDAAIAWSVEHDTESHR